MKQNNIPTSKELRTLASDLRKYAKEAEEKKLIKCAKYVVGITALMQLKNKLREL